MAETEVPTETKPTEEEKPAPAKKEKKPKAPKEKKPKGSKPSAAPSHPPYFQMIKEAIQGLKEKTGSSAYAIAKHMEEKYKAVLPANFRKILGLQLKNFAAKGKLVKVKNSFKLSDAGKKEEDKTKKKTKKPETEKKMKKTMGTNKGKATETVDKTKKKVAMAKKQPVVKKAKRATAAKPKQPKSIKSPAMKRARKAAA